MVPAITAQVTPMTPKVSESRPPTQTGDTETVAYIALGVEFKNKVGSGSLIRISEPDPVAGGEGLESEGQRPR